MVGELGKEEVEKKLNEFDAEVKIIEGTGDRCGRELVR